jgi:ATP-dependent helicase IRC3
MRPSRQPFRPRPYQEKAVREVLTRYNGGARKMPLHLPTGAGKTVIATLTIECLLPMIGGGKVLFIAHRRELLDQTAEKLERHLPGVAVSVDQGERRADPAAQVIIALIQSFSKRKDAYFPGLFSVIVCDECHRALAPSWVEVMEHFDAARAADALLLAMTAPANLSSRQRWVTAVVWTSGSILPRALSTPMAVASRPAVRRAQRRRVRRHSPPGRPPE